MQSADHTIYRQYSLLTIGSVSSFLEATGLGISFPASSERTALVLVNRLRGLSLNYL